MAGKNLKTGMFLAAISALFPAGNALAQPPAAGATRPAGSLEDLPHATITNGLISAKVYVPGKDEMYRGTRFDHAGVVTHLTYKGQDFSRYWFDRYAVDVFDKTERKGIAIQNSCCAVTGPVEEFSPVGFDEAGMGGRFLKIGVGILKRDTDTYSSFPTYPILDEGKRTAKVTGTGARFTQDLQDKATGYGYSYTKTVKLTPGRAQMTIAHVLKNTGSKPIIATVFCHNFLSLDPGNANMELTAPFALTAEHPLQPELAKIDGKNLRYVAPLKEGDTVTSFITGFGDGAGDYDFRIRNRATGFGERIRADQPLARINLWSVPTTFSWEPYIAISLKPGETKRWTYTYDLFGPGEG